MRNQRPSFPAAWLAFAVVLALAGCNVGNPDPAEVAAHGKPIVARPALDITRIDVGPKAAADGSVANLLSRKFAPTDVIHAAVTTDGVGTNVAVMARWIFQDSSMVNRSTKFISPKGEQVTTFEITNGAPWPVGNYKLEIYLNGQKAAITSFTVAP